MRYLTAQEAADELGVSLATLYAYVSRGQIRSEEVGGSKRNRRYYAEDVQRLKDRKEQRRHPEKVAEDAMHWGTPVMESGITLIENGRLYYRGLDAAHLAREHSFEQAANLIWKGDVDSSLFGTIELSTRTMTVRQRLNDLSTFALFQTLLPVMAADDPTRFDLRPAASLNLARRILGQLTLVAAGLDRFDGNVAPFLRQAWTPDQPEAAQLIDAVLILCADHEFNVSAFTARCVASAGATLYDVVGAGLSALHGSKHGGHTRRVEALLREIGSEENIRDTLINRLSRGETIPGFGHVLYPDGDPRGRLLLDRIAEVYNTLPSVRLAQRIEHQVFDLFNTHPTIDFALVALANALGLPQGTALSLFALGRAVGWIGHAIEQYQTDTLIRPRARYTGAQPM